MEFNDFSNGMDTIYMDEIATIYGENSLQKRWKMLKEKCGNYFILGVWMAIKRIIAFKRPSIIRKGA